MQKVTIELSTESCKAALEELKKYERDFNSKMEEVCRRLAEIGAREASFRFARGDHGNSDATVTTQKFDKGYKIVASGKDVYFIEFGTGFNAGVGYGDGMPSGLSVPVYPGSWSEEHKKLFSEQGFWWYGGEKLQGTEAEMPMYYASKAMRNNIKKVVEEVFKK